MKIFAKPMSLVCLKQNIKCLAKRNGVNRVTYNNRGIYVDGTYHTKTKVIYICSKLTKSNILQTFFHEFAHHIACKRGWWKMYHFEATTNTEFAFRVENKIDRLARKLWCKYVDSKIWGKYHFAYLVQNKRKHIKILNTYYGLD